MNNNFLLKASVSVTILGIAFLLVVLAVPSYSEIDEENINDFDINEKVICEGKVNGERDIGELKILDVDGIDVICDCKSTLLNKEILVKGAISEYNGEKQVTALRIELL